MENKNLIRNLINELRDLSKLSEIKEIEVTIPDDCEKYGFAQGNHNLSVILHFLADMLE